MLRARLDQWLYPQFGDRWDVLQFREAVVSQIKPGMRILDLGAGRGALEELNLQGLGAEIWGADVDPAVLTNPNLDKAFVIGQSRFEGIEDHSVDMVVSCNVLEHVADPESVLSEISRTLRPGGTFLAKTPNKFHYMPLIAAITPNWFHRTYNRWRGRAEVDTFPTLYRINSRTAVMRLAKAVGMRVERIWTVEGRPEYLRLTPPTYLAGWAYERFVNSLNLDDLKSVLFIHLSKLDRKPEAA